MSSKLADAYLRNIVRTYRTYKEMAEKAVEQVPSEDDLNRELDESSNSIAIIMKHMSGNLRSRFRDFLTSDGEKPDRNRDTEFESDGRVSREQLLRSWNDAWKIAMGSIEALSADDLDPHPGAIVLGTDGLGPVEWDDLSLYAFDRSQTARSR